MRDLSGTKLGHYEVRERLGVGGMAVVYRAVQSSLGREVALKVLAPALSQDESFLARFENEARTVARLDRLRRIPPSARKTSPNWWPSSTRSRSAGPRGSR